MNFRQRLTRQDQRGQAQTRMSGPLRRPIRVRVVGEAVSPAEALGLVRRRHPRQILLGVPIAGTDGLDFLVRLKEGHPKISLLVLAVSYDARSASRTVAAVCSGYLRQSVVRADLLRAPADRPGRMCRRP